MAENKNRRVTVKFKKSQFKCLYDKAVKEGLSYSEYVRELVLKDCCDHVVDSKYVSLLKKAARDLKKELDKRA